MINRVNIIFNFFIYLLNTFKNFNFYFFIPLFSIMGIGDWGLGIGDWGLGIGDWGLGDRRAHV